MLHMMDRDKSKEYQETKSEGIDKKDEIKDKNEK